MCPAAREDYIGATADSLRFIEETRSKSERTISLTNDTKPTLRPPSQGFTSLRGIADQKIGFCWPVNCGILLHVVTVIETRLGKSQSTKFAHTVCLARGDDVIVR